MRELEARMDAREIAEWSVYEQFEPFGMERIDLGFASITAMLYNINKKKGAKQKAPNDFMPKFRDYGAAGPQAAKREDMMDKMLRLVRKTGGLTDE